MPKLSPSNTCTFSLKAHHFYLPTPDNTSALHPRAILNSEITNKKHRNVENVTLQRPPEGHLFTLRAETRRQSVTVLHPQLRRCTLDNTNFTTLCMSMNDGKSSASSDLGLQTNSGRKWIHKYWYLWKMRADSSSSSNDSAHHNFKY